MAHLESLRQRQEDNELVDSLPAQGDSVTNFLLIQVISYALPHFISKHTETDVFNSVFSVSKLFSFIHSSLLFCFEPWYGVHPWLHAVPHALWASTRPIDPHPEPTGCFLSGHW